MEKQGDTKEGKTEILEPSWKKKPQIVRFFRDKKEARCWLMRKRILKRLHTKQLKSKRVLFTDEDNIAVMKNRIFSQEQAAALEAQQKLLKEMLKLCRAYNTNNVVFSLELNALHLPQVAAALMEIDMQISEAMATAKRLGIEPVQRNIAKESQVAKLKKQLGVAA